jgi:hypothetical protein
VIRKCLKIHNTISGSGFPVIPCPKRGGRAITGRL